MVVTGLKFQEMLFSCLEYPSYASKDESFSEEFVNYEISDNLIPGVHVEVGNVCN